MSKDIQNFKEVFCCQCQLCYAWPNENFKPEFCFELFKKNPDVFETQVFFRMLSICENMDGWEFSERDLQFIFCDTGVCFLGDKVISRACFLQENCLKKFEEQAGMGKSKHKNKNKIYSEKQFLEIICPSCNICDKDHDPEFCYYEIYKHNPEQFELLGSSQRGCHDEVPDTKKYNDYWEVRQNGKRTGSTGGKTNENTNLLGNDGKKNYFINKDGRIIQSTYQDFL